MRQQLDELITRKIQPIDPDFSLTQKVKPLSYQEIQTLAAENTAILQWYITFDKFLAFMITSDSLLTHPSKWEKQESEPWQSSKQDREDLINWGNEYLGDYTQHIPLLSLSEYDE